MGLGVTVRLSSSSFPRYPVLGLVAIQLVLGCSTPAWGSPPGDKNKVSKAARTLTITSTPAGARVELNGVLMGRTPLQLSYDKSYFEGKRYLWSKYLGESVTMVTSAPGCDTDTRVITRGPLTWDNGQGNVFQYYVFEAPQFDVELQCGAPSGGDAPQAPRGQDSNGNAPQPPPAGNPEPPPAGDPAQLSTVNVTSVPAGADINVDGRWMGSTPSTLRLPAGEHQISIEKEGLTPWQRTMTVTAGGTVSISATLEKPNLPKTAPGSAPK